MYEQLSLFAEIDAAEQKASNWAYGVRMLKAALEARLDSPDENQHALYRTVMASDLYRLIQFIDECTEREARLAEICRTKDELINKQVKRIMHLEGVRG